MSKTFRKRSAWAGMWLAILATPGLFTDNKTLMLLSLCTIAVSLFLTVPYLEMKDGERREEEKVAEEKKKKEEKEEMEKTSESDFMKEIDYFAKKVKIGIEDEYAWSIWNMYRLLGTATQQDTYVMVLMYRRRAKAQGIPPFK